MVAGGRGFIALIEVSRAGSDPGAEGRADPDAHVDRHRRMAISGVFGCNVVLVAVVVATIGLAPMPGDREGAIFAIAAVAIARAGGGRWRVWLG